MIRKTALVVTLTLGVFGLMSAEADEAAAQFRIGPNLGWNFDIEEGFIGGDIWLGLLNITEAIELHGNAAFHWYFVGEGVTAWGLDLNVPFLFKLPTEILRVYAAPGIGIFQTSIDALNISETDFAFNIIGGALFLPDSFINPYAQVRFYISDNSGAEILGGAMFKF